MNEIFINIKKNLYELISAILLIGLFYAKNKLVHDYFSYRGVFQSIRFKIFKIEKLSQLLVLSGADRSILYELVGDTFIPSAFSLRDGISFHHGESIDKSDSLFDWSNKKEYIWSESNHHLPVSALNNCKSILYSLIKNQDGKPAAILMLHYVFKAENKTNFTLLNTYRLKIKDILYMEKEDSKKLLAVLISFLTRLVELITIKNILRIALMALNIRIIQSELSREGYTFITLPIYGVGTEIPLVLLLLFAAIANSGLLEGLLFLYTRLIEGKFKGTRSKA
jgi:hypothetical protein